jgi:hypothetical protein
MYVSILILYVLCKMEEKTRVQLDIPNDVLKILEQLAVKDKRTRKNYMEFLLIKHAEEHRADKKKG